MPASKHPDVKALPTSDQVGDVIVMACRFAGADPLAVASGKFDPKGSDCPDLSHLPIAVARGVRHANSRGRAYAAFALRQIFPLASKSALARMCGVSWNSAGAYYSAMDQRRAAGELPWLDQVEIDKIVSEWWVDQPFVEEIETVAVEPTPAPSKQIAPYRGGVEYRPPAGTAAKVLADDADDDSPVFERGSFGREKRAAARPVVSKRQMMDELHAAAQRTAAMQKPEE